jgi:hypothetical protein
MGFGSGLTVKTHAGGIRADAGDGRKKDFGGLHPTGSLVSPLGTRSVDAPGPFLVDCGQTDPFRSNQSHQLRQSD